MEQESNRKTPRIAVFPFRDPVDDPESRYFGEGIAAELFLGLARIPGVHVAARSAVTAVAQLPLSLHEAARRVDASAILTGTIDRSGEKLRVQAELVEIGKEEPLWSEYYERDEAEILDVLDEILAGVVVAFRRPLDEDYLGMIARLHSSRPAAYDYYIQGREKYFQYSRNTVREAAALFQRAIDIDETYALAYCGLADCYAYEHIYVDCTADYLERARSAAETALRLDSSLAEAHASMGFVLSTVRKHAAADAAFKRALELDPRLYSARFLYARALFARGALREARTQFEAAHNCRPEDYQSLLFAGQVHADLGETERAAERRREGVRLAERHLALDPGETRALYLGANGLIALGEHERAMEWLEKALEIEPDEPMLLYNAGCIYALAGQTENSLDCLERSVDAGLRQRGWFVNDSNLDSVRDHPRFKAILRRLV